MKHNATTLSEVLRNATTQLMSFSDSAQLDAELLLCHLLKYERHRLISNSELVLSTEQIEQYKNLINRRLLSEPVAYIIGCKEFYGRSFSVNKNVLCPRPETELLIELALKKISKKKDGSSINFLDLGTGSGCIAITLALELESLGIEYHAIATDLSELALVTAQYNYQELKAKNIKFLKSNWFEKISTKNKYDLILSNPPYVDKNLPLSKDLSFEPEQALYADSKGLLDIEKILNSLSKYLSARGIFLCEIGSEQGRSLLDWLSQEYQAREISYQAKVHKDLAGLDRVLELEFSGTIA